MMIATVFSSLSLLFADYSARENAHYSRAGLLADQLERLRMPKDLVERVLSYMQYMHDHSEAQNLNMQNNDLNEPLQAEITVRLHKHMLQGVSLLGDCSPAFFTEVMQRLVPRLYQPEDVVITQGSLPDGMYVTCRTPVLTRERA